MTDNEIFDIATLIHSQWVRTVQDVRVVENERNDGSRDWTQFHEMRRENARKANAHWFTLKMNFQDEYRYIFDRFSHSVS